MISPVLAVNTSTLLKQETKTLHAATEKVMLQQIQSIQSEAHYVQFLSMLYGYFSPLEETVFSFFNEALLPQVHARKRTHLLHQDAAALGMPLLPCRATALPAVNSLAAAFGVLYVLEGATLGGVHIAAMLEKKLPLSLAALRFFKGHGVDTAAMWQSFQQSLNNHVQSATEKEAALLGANQTFTFMKQWMEDFGK